MLAILATLVLIALLVTSAYADTVWCAVVRWWKGMK
jgi:hypothetical protein